MFWVGRHDRLKVTQGPQKGVGLRKLSHLKRPPMKPISAFPYIAMLVVTVLLILMFLGYFQ